MEVLFIKASSSWSATPHHHHHQPPRRSDQCNFKAGRMQCSHHPNLITVVWNKWMNRWQVIHSSLLWHKGLAFFSAQQMTPFRDLLGELLKAFRGVRLSFSWWLESSALFMPGRMEVEESPDPLVCYQLTTIGHLLPASYAICVCIFRSNSNWVSVQVLCKTGHLELQG